MATSDAQTRRIHPHVLVAPARLAGVRGVPTAAAAAVYFATAAAVTWPLVANLDSSIFLAPGRPLGDYTGVIAFLREMVDSGENPFLPGRLDDFNAPDGHPMPWALNVVSFPRTLLLYVLTAVFGSVAAFGLFVLIGFTASGTAMFAFLRSRGVTWLLALTFGWAFAFYPFALSSGEGPDYLHGWVFVVMAWRLWRLHEDPGVRNGLWAGLATLLCLSWNPYFILIGGVLYATAVALDLGTALFRRELRQRVVPHVVAAALVALFLLSAALLSLAGSDVTGQRAEANSLVDVMANAARPKYYFIPPDWSFLWGGWSTEFWFGRGIASGHERALYVGISVVLLALIAGVSLLRRRLAASNRALVIAAAVTGAVAALFSAPPEVGVGGELIKFPSYYVFELTASWRIFSRFVIVVMLALCVLAAIGASRLANARGTRWRAVALVAIAIAVPLDLLGSFEQRTRTDVDPPEIYDVLREQPDGIVAEYPIRPAELAGDYRDLFFQDAHDKPMLNGFPARSYEESRALAVADLNAPRTAPTLAALGVRYVMLLHEPLLTGPGIIERQQPRGGTYEEIASDDYAAIYEVHARPVPLVEPRDGFGDRDVYENPGRPMLGRSATMRIKGPCEQCSGTLTFLAESPAGARTLEVSTGDGEVLHEGTVDATPAPVRIPLEFRESVDLSFRVSDIAGDAATAPMIVRSPEVALNGRPPAQSIW
jgi:hypothetical protein